MDHPKLKRCTWCLSDPLYIQYHDQVWGREVRDSKELFRMLILEGAQAGLSWLTVLKRFDDYDKAFYNFDAKKMAAMSEEDILSLMQNSGIIRNRNKIESAIQNAKAYLKLKDQGINFSEFLWSFAPVNSNNLNLSLSEIPTQTPESELMSKELKKRGFNFVGPTICYAFMQAVGMVDDHAGGCYLYKRD
ncbi:MAG: DNA-3-methyladenine glycosylase I [Candidatus Saccharimonadales bacterium]